MNAHVRVNYGEQVRVDNFGEWSPVSRRFEMDLRFATLRNAERVYTALSKDESWLSCYSDSDAWLTGADADAR